MRQPSTEWYTGMTPEQKASFEKVLRGNTLLLDRLIDILNRWENELIREETSKDDFTEGWAYKQAARNGDKRRIHKLRDLVSFFKG